MVAETPAGDDGGPLTVPVTTDSDIVCVITNTRETGKLEVQKDLSPSTDDGLFNLQIDGTTDPDATDVGDGGSTGEETLNTGDHTVGETAGTDTDLADYQKSIQCRDQDGTGDVVAETPAGDNGGPLTVPVTTDSDIVCVITNTRETGKLEVQKAVSPSTDGGLFNLQIDGTTDPDATDVGDSGSTGEETLDTGDHTVGETAGTGTDLADYQKSIVCRDDNGTGAVVAGTTGDDGGPLTVPVTTDSDIVCKITNSRDTGKLEVQKDLSPTTDGGLFNLQIDGTTDPDATDVGDGGSTGEETVNTGDHQVGEAAGTDTDLADYQKSIECKDDNGTGAVVASTTGDDAGPLTVPVTTGSDIVCVITNTRETGKLEVLKALDPDTDPGKFNLQIDGTTDPDATDVGDSGSTGEETLDTGDHTVGETAGTGTDLDDYQKSIVCRDDNGTGGVVAETPAGDDAGPLTVPVTTDSDIVCLITNTRETGKLEVQKDLNPSTDTGRFNLLIDGSSPNAGSQNVGDGGTTGERTLNTGDHTVGESAVLGTDLAKYAKSIVCKDGNGSGDTVAATTSDDAGPLTVPVTLGDDIVCVITNTRETGKLEVRKDLEPNTDPGKFNLQIDNVTDPDAINVGDGGSTGEQVLNTGNHTVRETAGTATNIGRLPEVDRVQGRQRHRHGGRVQLRQPRAPDRERHGRLRHRLHDHQHPQDRQARGREEGQPDDRRRPLRPADRRQRREGRGRPQRHDRREDAQHRQPHRVRDGRRRDDADRLLVEHRVQGDQRDGRSSRAGHRLGAGDGECDQRIRHRVHDHEHSQDRQARGREEGQPDDRRRPLRPADRQHGPEGRGRPQRHDRREDRSTPATTPCPRRPTARPASRTTRAQSSARRATGQARSWPRNRHRAGDRERHGRLRHPVHDHQHAQDRASSRS